MSADILTCVKEFYVLEAVKVLAQVDEFKRSHDKWLEEFTSYRDTYINRFEQAIYDYTVVVVAGEMRHGYSHAHAYCEALPVGGSRTGAYLLCKKYKPETILSAGDKLFNEFSWAGGYGGKAWGKISTAALQRNQWGKIPFIDHCIDLSHNSNPYFDKAQSEIFQLNGAESYRAYLDQKAKYPPEMVINLSEVSPTLLQLVKRAMSLGILSASLEPRLNVIGGSSVSFILNYTPIEWGEENFPQEINTSLKPHLASENNDDDDDHDDDEDEDDSQDDESYSDEGEVEEEIVDDTQYSGEDTSDYGQTQQKKKGSAGPDVGDSGTPEQYAGWSKAVGPYKQVSDSSRGDGTNQAQPTSGSISVTTSTADNSISVTTGTTGKFTVPKQSLKPSPLETILKQLASDDNPFFN